jgi:hypothetical protein
MTPSLTSVQPAAVTALQMVSWHVAHADDPDPRFRGDVNAARAYLAESVAIGWITEEEANTIRRVVGWEVKVIQMRLWE